MGFWIFMLLMVVLTPAIMVFFGKKFQTTPPASINHLYGYRTRRSMGSEAAWVFAHRCCGRLWVHWDLGLLVVSALAMLAVLGRGMNAVACVAMVLVTVQIAAMVATICFVERELKRNFGE